MVVLFVGKKTVPNQGYSIFSFIVTGDGVENRMVIIPLLYILIRKDVCFIHIN